jgi:hypothetical protein
MFPLKRSLAAFALSALFLSTGCSDDDPVAPEPEPPERIPVERTHFSSDYLNNQFFRLDLPEREANGRTGGERIDIPSIRFFQFMGTGTPQRDDVTNVAAYVDSTGFRDWDDIDFADPYDYGYRWRHIQLNTVDLMFDVDGELVALDLREDFGASTVLACTYRVLDGVGNLVAQVGDDPYLMLPEQEIPGSPELHYRMKLLKARANKPDPHVFDYILRNIYSLGSRQIDPSIFDFRIEFNDVVLDYPQVDEMGIDYLHIFGLDSKNQQGEPGRDGIADFHDPTLFDLDRGYLKFPLDFPHPFAAGEEAYRQNLDPDVDNFGWEGTRLAQNQTPELYDSDVLPSEYPQFAKFRLVVETMEFPPPPPFPLPQVISLERTDWFWASAPFVGENDPNPQIYPPENRVDHVRWFLPKDRVLRRYLDPDLPNSQRDITQPAMNMYLRSDDGAWDAENWGGIMQGVSRSGWDLGAAENLEIWLNDGEPDIAQRRGRLHIDFGYLDEDGFWPLDDDGWLVVRQWEAEDINHDGIWTYDEDIGLDGNEFGPQRYQADYEIDGDTPFPRINGTARNNREDTEDINGNSWMDRDNGYFTTVIDLRATEPEIDVVHDYENVQDLVAEGIAWRKYRVPLDDLDNFSDGTTANIRAVTHFRIWYEDPTGTGPSAVEIQISDLRFN